MFYRKNLPVWERTVRVGAGAAVAIAGFWMGLSGATTGLLAGSGVFLAATGFVGFCPMCAMLGRRLDAKTGGR